VGVKAKTCPECSDRFFRRSRGCCPHCGVELVIPRSGRVVTRREYGDRVKIFKHFSQEYMAPRRTFFGAKGSKLYITQLGFASRLIADACLYLGYNSRFDLDPTEFAIQCLDYLFSARGWTNYASRIDTILMCNGRAFWAIAPKVLIAIEKTENDDAIQTLHSGNINNQIDVPVLG